MRPRVWQGGLGRLPYPDYARLSHREYGHRVGIFRVLDVLEKHGIAATIAMDALTAQHYPYLVQHCRQRDCEIIGHGLSVSRMITSRMSEAEERDYIHTSIETLTQAIGQAPVGWLGPEYGESERTPQLLAAAGLRYVCDWANDEQPYHMTAGEGELVSLPIALELDDVHALWERRVPVDRYGTMLSECFEGLYQDGAKTGRLLVLNLHPWLIGQPFRIGFLDAALGGMMRRQGVWTAHGSAIVDWFRQHGT
ncbi:polysaccharide deacetylase family protein [Candidatus Entotheonella palauensis]|uniref:polysaccharide deacetylase family protein n=1 Tax=Candidatus Entotheonella palauensis TaxID=93172 RepID=UPI0015C4AD36|nr:polysaccharide deacetylase family protein [Candidatus Entotheonella palauensis]